MSLCVTGAVVTAGILFIMKGIDIWRMSRDSKDNIDRTVKEVVPVLLPAFVVVEVVPPSVPTTERRELKMPSVEKENRVPSAERHTQPKLVPLVSKTSQRPALKRVNLNQTRPDDDDSAFKASMERRRQLMERIQGTLSDVSKTHSRLYGEVAEIRRSYACTATASHCQSDDDDDDDENRSLCSAPAAIQRC